jgi:tRNA(fMet)-specific endonuclease VapC
MIYMFDTDIIGYLARGTSVALKKKLEKENPENLALSSVAYAEISYGLEKKGSKSTAAKVHALIDNIRITAFDRAAADMYAKIRAQLERSGTPLENMDMLIAASAMSEGAVLVTHNTKHFKKINDLKIEDWC